MPKLSFVSNDNGANYSKARKRIRGDSNRRPEIKSYDPLRTGSLTDYAAHACYCGYAYNQTTADIAIANYHWNHSPFRLYWPAIGTGSNQRIGTEIFLKYVRIKGMVQVDNYVTCGVRWRLVMLKLNPGGNDDNTISMNIAEYLNMFDSKTVSQPSTWTPYSVSAGGDESVSNFDDSEAGSLMNYYYKVKDVQKWVGWKRKVLASGYVPPSFVPTGQSGTIVTAGNNPQVESVSLLTERFGDATTDYQFNSPLDIKITLNDRVNIGKATSVYYLVFESDCSANFTAIGGLPHTSTRGFTGSPVKLNFIAKAYFTDS